MVLPTQAAEQYRPRGTTAALQLLQDALAATEPPPHNDGVAVWTRMWNGLAKLPEGRTVVYRGTPIRVQASGFSDSVLRITTGTSRSSFTEYYPRKSQLRDVVDVQFDYAASRSRNTQFQITAHMTPATLLATIVRCYHGLMHGPGVTAAAEPAASDPYGVYMELVRKLPHSNPGQEIRPGITVRSYLAPDNDQTLHVSYISVRIHGVLFSVGVNHSTPDDKLTVNSAAGPGPGLNTDIAIPATPAALLRRIIGICADAYKGNHK